MKGRFRLPISTLALLRPDRRNGLGIDCYLCVRMVMAE